MWTRTSRSHDIAGPVHQMSVLVVLDGGACPGALQAPRRSRRGQARSGPRPRRTPTPRAQTSRQSHGERHAIATTRVVLYPTIKQWNGCPSDKRQLVWCVVHAVKGRTGGRCGRPGGRPSGPARAPAHGLVRTVGSGSGPGPEAGREVEVRTHRGRVPT